MTDDHPIIKAFTDAARETLGTMALLEMEVAEVQVADKLSSSLHYTATMGLCGANEGLLVVSLESDLARNVVSSMLGMGEDEIDDDLIDGVSELANMIAGSAKTALSVGRHTFDLSIPATISGEKNQICPRTGTPGAIARCTVQGQSMLIGVWMSGLSDAD